MTRHRRRRLQAGAQGCPLFFAARAAPLTMGRGERPRFDSWALAHHDWRLRSMAIPYPLSERQSAAGSGSKGLALNTSPVTVLVMTEPSAELRAPVCRRLMAGHTSLPDWASRYVAILAPSAACFARRPSACLSARGRFIFSK